MWGASKMPHGAGVHKTEPHSDKDQLHRDRMHALITLLVLVAMFVVLALLATTAAPPEGIDFHNRMMP